MLVINILFHILDLEIFLSRILLVLGIYNFHIIGFALFLMLELFCLKKGGSTSNFKNKFAFLKEKFGKKDWKKLPILV